MILMKKYELKNKMSFKNFKFEIQQDIFKNNKNRE